MKSKVFKFDVDNYPLNIESTITEWLEGKGTRFGGVCSGDDGTEKEIVSQSQSVFDGNLILIMVYK